MIDFLLGVPGKLKTLTDRLTADRAANLDDLDTTVSSRAAASTALSSATWTNTKAGYIDAAITGTNTAATPQSMTYTKSTERVRASLTWSSGNVTVASYYYSADSGATYDLIGTNTITYDGSGNVTATTWS